MFRFMTRTRRCVAKPSAARSRRQGSRFVAQLLVAFIGLQSATTTAFASEVSKEPEPPPNGTWNTLLDARDLRKVLTTPSGDRETDVVKAAKIINAVVAGHRDLIPPERIKAITASVHFAEVDRIYRNEVLEPLSVVSEEEARAYFDAHRAGFQRPAGAKLLEIFLWAPEDLPELRADRRATLVEIRETAQSEEAFSAAAERLSDATSYQNGGRIGTIMADQVGGRLREVVDGGGSLGPTDVLSTPEGHYLFFVLSRVPPREANFAQVEERIANRLTREALETARLDEKKRLEERFAIDLDPPVGLFSVGGTTYSRDTAGLGPDLEGSKLEKAAERRAFSIAREAELTTRKIAVATPPEKLAMALYAAIYPVLLDARLKAAQVPQTTGGDVNRSDRPPRTIQRWDFEMLTLADDGGKDALFALMRIRHELENRAPLEKVQELLQERFDLSAAVVRRTGVLAPDAAAMGPEIYRTLKHHLEIGEISRPLHIDNSHRFVMLRLDARTLDAEAGLRERADRDRARERRVVREALERELLGDADSRRRVDPDDLIETQRRQ